MKEGFNFDAIYRYGIRSQETGLLHYFDVACEIIGETDKSYRIRLKGVVERHEQGEIITVRKRSITNRSYYDKERRYGVRYMIWSLKRYLVEHAVKIVYVRIF